MKGRTIFWNPDDLQKRLKRMEGQIRGIAAMVDRKEPCRDILMQISAVQGALLKVSRIMEACSVAEGLSSLENDERAEPELVKAVLERVIERRASP